MIAYCNPRWREEDGGALELLDEPGRCWRSVLPLADTLLLFRAPHVLHRVAATHAPLYAVSAWWHTADEVEAAQHAALRDDQVVLCKKEGTGEIFDGGNAGLSAQLVETMVWLCAQTG